MLICVVNLVLLTVLQQGDHYRSQHTTLQY